MPKPKTRVAQKRNHDRFSLRSPLKVVANDQGELVYEEAGSPSAEEQDLALELLAILRNAITRASIALSPGEGLEIVRLEMDAWSQEGREELRTEFVSCLERLAETKRQSGEAETTSYAHVKSLEMRFRPGAGFAPAGDASEPHRRSSLTNEGITSQYMIVDASEANTKERRPDRASLAEGTLPPVPIELPAPAIQDILTLFQRFADANPGMAGEAAAKCQEFAERYRHLDTRRVISAHEAEQITGLARPTLTKFGRDGVMGAQREDGQWFFSGKELAWYLANRPKRGPKGKSKNEIQASEPRFD